MTQHDVGATQRRPSFTILELLVVLLIIAVLMALAAAAAFRAIGGQQAANSKTEVKKLQIHLLSQMKIVREQAFDAKRSTVPQGIAAMGTANGLLANDGETRGRVLYAKYLIRQEFPMNFWEIYHPPAVMGPSPYLVKLQAGGVPDPGGNPGVPGPEESAICLALALSRSRGGDTKQLSDLVTTVVKSPTYPALDMLVDGWGNPLGFYRWPTDNTDVNPGGATAGKNDPMDPDGLLNNPTWVNSPAGGGLFMRDCHKVAPGASYTLVPVLVSGGRDGLIGVQQLPASTPNGMQKDSLQRLPPAASDDIYSYAP